MSTEDLAVAATEHGPLTIRSSRQEDAHIVALHGELDLASCGGLRDQMGEIEQTDADHIVLDLSGLEFMDSHGLRTILEIEARSRSDGKRLGILRGRPAVQRLFQLTDTEDRLSFLD